MNDKQFSKAGFLKTYALPVLFVMLIPAVGWWFSSHAIGRFDAQVRGSALSAIQLDLSLDAAEREQARSFYAIPVSTVCRGAASQLETMPPAFGPLCSKYAQFFWMRRIAIACIAIGILAFLFASGCVLTSLISQRTLYAGFLAGWNVLKVASLLQAIGQGTLAVLLSYWVTVLWFDRYYPKLILLAVVAAGAAVLMIVKAIFKRIDIAPRVDGTLLTERMAPRFWAHVRDMCRRLETAPPTQIIVGVDDNFFVTENPMVLGDNRLEGRSLFMSFSLLRFMEKQEADAVLAHEMAHFSGQDTLYTKKMSPLLARYSDYLRALYQAGLSRPIFHFMLFFWGLFQLSINRMSRQRELRADQIAADTTSATHMGRALLKVVAYTSYRKRIEEGLFSQNARQENLGIAGRVSAGFASYVASPHLLGDVGATLFPHPFDSHPSLNARLAAIRASIIPSHYPRLLVQPVAESWLSDIDDAEGIEQKMWQAYEASFSAAHEQSLAWRYVPQNDEEKAVVETHFPPQKYATSKIDATLEITYQHVYFSEWAAPIAHEEIASWKIRESFGRKFLSLNLGKGRPKAEVRIGRFGAGNELTQCFQRYYARHFAAKEHCARIAASKEGSE